MKKYVIYILFFAIGVTLYSQQNILTEDQLKYNFLYAIRSNNIKSMQNCIKMGVNINTQDNNGNTALHIAFKSNDALHSDKIIALLLQAGIRQDIKNNKGQTAYEQSSPMIPTQENRSRSIFCSCIFSRKAASKSSIPHDVIIPHNNDFTAEEYSLQYPQNIKTKNKS